MSYRSLFPKSTISLYRKNNLTHPWKVSKGIIKIAAEGYAYGSEEGQVRNISDHSNILPLYDYGVGTFDFDMSKVRPQVKLAQLMARINVYDFFK